MGVHDYCCFIQRNDQCIYQFTTTSDEEDSSCGSSDAIIVLVPQTFTKRDILSWPLNEFKKFKKINATYSWDEWGFEELEDYSDILSEDRKWYDQTVWESSSKPNYWLVNFEPKAYDAFVLQNVKPIKISKEYYEIVYENRGMQLPKPKQLAFDKIFNAGEENLYEYDGKVLKPLLIPKNFVNLHKKFEKNVLFTKKFKYSYKTPQSPNLFKDRIRVLIQDNIVCPEKLLKVSYRSWVNYDPHGISEMEFLFTPNVKTWFEPELIDGCLKCGKTRWIGKYVCLAHLGENVEELKSKRILKIKNESKILSENINLFEDMCAPCNLTCPFLNEKGVKYDLILNVEF